MERKSGALGVRYSVRSLFLSFTSPTTARKTSTTTTVSGVAVNPLAGWRHHAVAESWETIVGRPPNAIPRIVVEECEIVNASDALAWLKLGVQCTTVATRGPGRRLCLLCPQCSRRAFKLYRPMHLQAFACRTCHNLTYTSVQKHDARLDRLLKLPDWVLIDLMERSNPTWRILACRAGYIRLGLIDKY